MQQPCTNSEAVKRCMVMRDAPLSSHMRFTQPKPPYGINYGKNRDRPYSAPARRITASNSSEAWRGPRYQEPRIPVPPNYHTAPYASRKTDVYYGSMYSRVDGNGKSNPLPPYSALHDPHLTEYFDRRFGLIHAEAAKRRNIRTGWGSRPSSASSSYGSYMAADGRRRLKKKSHDRDHDDSTLYKVAIITGDRKNAGTDAKVFITVKGLKGKLPKKRLTKKAGSVKSNKDVAFRFSKGSTHLFKIRGPNIGELKSVIIEHNGIRKEDSWFLQEIEVTNVKKKKSWVFICNQWLSLHTGDQMTVRELFPRMASKTEYEVVTVTGDKLNGGTNANVFFTLYGKTGATEKIHLRHNNANMFDRGASDIFKFKANCVGPMRKVRIEHDNTGVGAGWYLERIVVTDLKHPQWKYFFPCGQWLARDEGDGAISRDLMGSKDPFGIRKENKYKITIYTGNVKGAGTDANVYITLFGENGDSGEKFLASKKNNFERGQTDEFILKTACLGRLERLRIGHDNSGFGPGWYLDKVIVDDIDNNIVYDFPCKRWLATDEDDGQISRDIIANLGPTTLAGITYIITVVTGDKANAGTDARVFVIMNGGKSKTSGKVWLETGKFKRNTTDIFNVDVIENLSPLSSIEVGHDNSGVGPGWFLDQVIVFCPSTGIEQVFPCGKWFAKDSGDGLIQRTLKEQKAVRKTKEKKLSWVVTVITSDKNSAGTDANVLLMAYGDKGKSDEISLDNKGDNFEKGQTDHFKIEMVDVGQLYKIRVWHDNSGMAAGWHLEKIKMENMTSKEKYTFNCDRWLADDEDDKSLIRELPAEGRGIAKPLPVIHYTVEVHTGKKFRAGTDANVFLNIFGELGDTGNRPLKYSKTNKNKFEKGNVDVFSVEAVTLRKISKIIIGHDGKGAGSGWFLDKVIVKQDGTDKFDTEFGCGRWLDSQEDDGQIVRELTAGSMMLSTTTYNVHVKTGTVRGAGTDANVFLKIFGTKGDTGELQLRTSENSSNKFEKGKTDLFKIEAVNIGSIKRIKIGHDNSKPGAGWYLDEVRIDIPSRGESYLFAIHRWLATDEGDGLTSIEIEPAHKEDREKRIPYEITIWTGDLGKAGTDANVYIQMYGEKGKTEQAVLNNRSDNFEKGQKDVFKVEEADIGRIQKVRIGHDGKGMMAGWYLEKMLIQRRPIKGTKKYKKRPPSAQQRRKSIISDLQGGDDYDSDGSSSSRSSSPTPRKRRSSSFKSHKKPQLKTVEEESEEDTYDGTETEDYWFFVNSWFARGEGDGALERELTPTDEKGRPLKGSLADVEYIVRVYTGDVSGAGTDSNVFINMYGENFDSGERALKDSTNFNKFETKQEDIFKVKAKELGKLIKLRIRHDNSGIGSAWFLDRVEVEDTKNRKTYYFLCQRWLATGHDDGQISRELVPVDKSLLNKSGKKDSARKEVALETKAAMTTYHVKVRTGTVWGAGTDANVYVLLYGDLDNTDKMFLKSSLTHKNKFESGNTDEFTLEAVNIGNLRKIKIGHDDAGGGAPWYLEDVVIDSPSLGKCWKFPCSRWLSKSDDDGQIERELFPQELATEEYIPCIPYEIKTYTSDRTSAGTSAEVYIQLYGKEMCSQQKMLCGKRDRADKFKRGAADLFLVELEDVGDTIEKIRIGHDNAGFTSGWHLNRVEIRKLHETGKGSSKSQGSITYIFPCDKWLARDEDDGAIERELIAQKALQETISKDGQVKKRDVKLRDQLKSKTYKVTVHTGDVSGAGTDANVFLTVFGDKGDSGERKLHKSETYSDKFERNHSDVFKLEIVDLGNVYKIKIRHDNSMFGPSWYLDWVEVEDTSNNSKFMFHCERWLAKNKDDKKIQRTLYVKGYDGEMDSSTGTFKSTRYGSVASLDSLRSTDPFSKSPRMSRKQMLASEDMVDGDTIPYTVKVATGNGDDNGTSSNVWVQVIGPRGKKTGRLFLELAQSDKFMPGSVETFSLEAIDVGDVKKLEIGHDGEAPGTGWFVKEVSVDVPTKGKHYVFQCHQWLARDKSDGKTIRVFGLDDGTSTVTTYRPMVQYECEVTTGDISEAGTDMTITLTVFGAKGTSAPIALEKVGDRFERGHNDLIKLEIEDIAPLRKLRVEASGKGSRTDWYCEKIQLRSMETGVLTKFKCNDWIGKKKGKLMKEMPAIERDKQVISNTSYRISVKTSDVKGAGTDSNVYVILFGANGDTGDLHLKKSETYKDPFENNQLDVFTIKDILSVGELSKCRVWHDNKGFGAAWHLNYIEVEDLSSKKTYTFHCDMWLSKSDGDKQIMRELTCGTTAKPSTPGAKDQTTYELEVKTSDKKEAGTIHNGWVILRGKKGSVKYKMENSPYNKILRRGNTDYFQVPSKPLGKLTECIVGAAEREDKPLQDPEGNEAKWYCYQISVTDTATGDKYIFPCKQWISISEDYFSKRHGEVLTVKSVEQSQVSVVRNLAPVKYEIIVHTGDVFGSGTNANVSITIYGTNGDTGKRPLQQSFRDLFERNQIDKFQIEALDLGELERVRIEHDNAGFRPGWFLDKIEIINMATNDTTVFPCAQWLDKGKGDKAICRDLTPLS